MLRLDLSRHSYKVYNSKGELHGHFTNERGAARTASDPDVQGEMEDPFGNRFTLTECVAIKNSLPIWYSY